MDVSELVVGMRFKFRYATSRTFQHRFYTSFLGSGGRAVRASEHFVDIKGNYEILEVRTTRFGGRAWVAVRFAPDDSGVHLWTNASRDGH